MIDSLCQRDPVEILVDDFASRCRRGETPAICEYTAKYPQYAEQIEKLFPTVALMERLRMQEKARREAPAGPCECADPPEHLGDFEIIREIGRGGMGIVYEAEQKSLGRRVAVKVLPKHVLLLDRQLERFKREAQTAARLQHTNIVPVFGAGDQDGLHYYVMPLVRGVGLDEIIRSLRGGAAGSSGRDVHAVARELVGYKYGASPAGKKGDSPRPTFGRCPPERPKGCFAQMGTVPFFPPRTNHWRTVARIGLQAAEALDYAHGQGTLHRDVKPGNLLIDAEGGVSVADFGLARAVNHADASHSGEVVGTLRYMAPEQLHGQADPRSDVYALGLTLYELLTLRPAFDDGDRRRCLKRRRSGLEPVRLSRINPAIPRDLETILLKCLASEPSKRYPTAAALAADLRCFLDDRPIHARRASWIEQVWRWSRRNRALAATSALAAVLLVAFTATAVTAYVQNRRAYAAATTALGRAEATSQLALDVLDDIYLQLSPDRVRIASDADPGGNACTCVGLRSGSGSTASAGRTAMQVQASRETASLLKDLLAFYDRLAEHDAGDPQVMLESAVASRRVGDIRQRLGQPDQAEKEYMRAVEKLRAIGGKKGTVPICRNGPEGASQKWGLSPFFADGSVETCVELARCYNEIGNVRSAKLEYGPAYQSHREALAVLQPFDRGDKSPEKFRFELARTLYFLASKQGSGAARSHEQDPIEKSTGPGPQFSKSNQCRKQAIAILEKLARENPAAPDYLFLLALCHRPPVYGPDPGVRSDRIYAVSSGVQTGKPDESGYYEQADESGHYEPSRGRQRAIEILEQLKEQYPGVVDYRYELAATYAWIHVGLFPWQKPLPQGAAGSEAEQSLRMALDELDWLVAHNPSTADYTRSLALVLAKLGTICWRTQRLAEAEDFFRRALETQNGLVAAFPDLPSHNRVVLEFIRLRLGQVYYDRHVTQEKGTGPICAKHPPGRSGKLDPSPFPAAAEYCRNVFLTCAEDLAGLVKEPELADDRLALASLPITQDALDRVTAAVGEHKKAAARKRRQGSK